MTSKVTSDAAELHGGDARGLHRFFNDTTDAITSNNGRSSSGRTSPDLEIGSLYLAKRPRQQQRSARRPIARGRWSRGRREGRRRSPSSSEPLRAEPDPGGECWRPVRRAQMRAGRRPQNDPGPEVTGSRYASCTAWDTLCTLHLSQPVVLAPGSGRSPRTVAPGSRAGRGGPPAGGAAAGRGPDLSLSRAYLRC